MEGASAAGFGLDSRICVTIEGKLQKTFIRVEQRGQGGGGGRGVLTVLRVRVVVSFFCCGSGGSGF
jgi:hypothetical protein